MQEMLNFAGVIRQHSAEVIKCANTDVTRGIILSQVNSSSLSRTVYLLEVDPKPVLSCLVFEKLEPDPDEYDLELPSPLLHPPLLPPHPLLVWLLLLPMRPAAYPAAAPPSAADHGPGLQPC